MRVNKGKNKIWYNTKSKKYRNNILQQQKQPAKIIKNGYSKNKSISPTYRNALLYVAPSTKDAAGNINSQRLFRSLLLISIFAIVFGLIL